jgi:hypothetical protein
MGADYHQLIRVCVMHKEHWILAYASATGHGHIAANLPCQDVCGVKLLADGWGIAVVSDGAGSCEHSQQGAQLTVQYAIEHFRTLITSRHWTESTEMPTVEAWRETASLALHDVFQELNTYATGQGYPLASLSCTVIVVIFSPFGLLAAHIGDGRAGFLSQSGEWQPLMTPFHGEYANQTVFVTSDIWEDALCSPYLETAIVTEAVQAFCLLSDGCERASYECYLYDEEHQRFYDPNKPYPPFFNRVVDWLRTLHRNGQPQQEMNELWAQVLRTGTAALQQETDDKTMIIAVQAMPSDG